jgi:hypothetical protein
MMSIELNKAVRVDAAHPGAMADYLSLALATAVAEQTTRHHLVSRKLPKGLRLTPAEARIVMSECTWMRHRTLPSGCVVHNMPIDSHVDFERVCGCGGELPQVECRVTAKVMRSAAAGSCFPRDCVRPD